MPPSEQPLLGDKARSKENLLQQMKEKMQEQKERAQCREEESSIRDEIEASSIRDEIEAYHHHRSQQTQQQRERELKCLHTLQDFSQQGTAHKEDDTSDEGASNTTLNPSFLSDILHISEESSSASTLSLAASSAANNNFCQDNSFKWNTSPTDDENHNPNALLTTASSQRAGGLASVPEHPSVSRFNGNNNADISENTSDMTPRRDSLVEEGKSISKMEEADFVITGKEDVAYSSENGKYWRHC